MAERTVVLFQLDFAQVVCGLILMSNLDGGENQVGASKDENR